MALSAGANGPKNVGFAALLSWRLWSLGRCEDKMYHGIKIGFELVFMLVKKCGCRYEVDMRATQSMYFTSTPFFHGE